jgi:hypothetical protein
MSNRHFDGLTEEDIADLREAGEDAYTKQKWMPAVAPSGETHLIHLDDGAFTVCGLDAQHLALGERSNGATATCDECCSVAMIELFTGVKSQTVSGGSFPERAYEHSEWITAAAPDGKIHLSYPGDGDLTLCGASTRHLELGDHTNGSAATCQECREDSQVDYFDKVLPAKIRLRQATLKHQWVYASTPEGDIHLVHVQFVLQQVPGSIELWQDPVDYLVCGSRQRIKVDMEMASGRAATCDACRWWASIEHEVPEPLPETSLLSAVPYDEIEDDYRARLMQHRKYLAKTHKKKTV